MSIQDLPLPASAHHAAYVGDMMEVADFDISTDSVLCRYVWMDGGERWSYLAKPITTDDACLDQTLMAALEDRRAEVRQHRGIA